MVFAKCQMLETKERCTNCEMHANLSILREWCANMSVLGEEVLAFGLFSFSLHIAPEIQNVFKLWSNIQTQVQNQKPKIRHF